MSRSSLAATCRSAGKAVSCHRSPKIAKAEIQREITELTHRTTQLKTAIGAA